MLLAVDLAHVKVFLDTSAFEATLSSREDRSGCTAKGSHNASFLEKTVKLKDYWAKYVIVCF